MKKQDFTQLSKISPGKKVRLVKIDAGQGLVSRLASMGLIRNAEFEVVQNRHPGPFVVNVKGTRLMLGRGMAAKILVK